MATKVMCIAEGCEKEALSSKLFCFVHRNSERKEVWRAHREDAAIERKSIDVEVDADYDDPPDRDG